MYGVTNSYIINTFQNMEDARVLSILRVPGSTPANVQYRATIQIPHRTINGAFECIATKDNKPNKPSFSTDFIYGTLKVKMNTAEEIQKLKTFLIELSKKAGTVIEFQSKARTYWDEMFPAPVKEEIAPETTSSAKEEEQKFLSKKKK